jgi:hypothetical protein
VFFIFKKSGMNIAINARPLTILVVAVIVLGALMSIVPMKQWSEDFNRSGGGPLTAFSEYSYVTTKKVSPDCSMVGIAAYSSYYGWPFRTYDPDNGCRGATSIYFVSVLFNLITAGIIVFVTYMTAYLFGHRRMRKQQQEKRSKQ